jgi:hypothetical protein
MKLPALSFRKDAVAGQQKATEALNATEARIVQLEEDRRLALQETDATAPVVAADRAIAEARVEASIHRDRIAALRTAVAEQQAADRQKEYDKAVGMIERRLGDQVMLAREVESAVANLGERWNKLLSWRQAIISQWPEGLPLPRATDFQDLRDLRRELGVLLWSAGKPAWNRPTSIPTPIGPVGVLGLEPAGLAKYVEGAGKAFVARLRMRGLVNHETQTDEESAA